METLKTIPKKLHIFECDDWSAIYADGKLVHWHDTPSLTRFADVLGIDCEWDTLPNSLKSDPPDDVDVVLQAIAENEKKKAKAARLRSEADKIEKEIEAGGVVEPRK